MPVAQPEHSPAYRAGHQMIIAISEKWPTYVYNIVISYYVYTGSLGDSLDLARELLQQDYAMHNFG